MLAILVLSLLVFTQTTLADGSDPDWRALRELSDLLAADDVCSLPRERGPCSNYEKVWYFDTEKGHCARFFYGGCQGNGNRFQTEKECLQHCHRRPQECNNALVDIVFVLDASTSVTEQNFLVMKNFIKDLLFNASFDDGNIRVGILTYSTEDHLQFNLNEYHDKLSMFDAIDNIPYRHGSTNTADALKTMRTEMFTTDSGDRPDVPNVAIVITDGVSNINPSQTIPEAERARGQGIHIYAIGIGLMDTTELDGIASKPVDENRFNVQKFSELKNLRSKVFTAFCEKSSSETLPSPAIPIPGEKRYVDKSKNAATRLKEKVKKIKDMGEFDEKCEQEPIDLGLVIDSSVSIHRDDFKTGLKFLNSFLDEYDIGSGKKQVRVAAVSFGYGVYTNDGFNMSTYKTKEQVQDHIKNLPFRQGPRTDTGAALEHMREFQMQNTRPWATKLVVVLTDGDSQLTKKTKTEALLTKQDNITVFAVGVGRRIKKQELLNIAGGVEDHVFQAESYDDLGEDIKKELTRKTCVLVPKPTTTTVPTTQAEQECGVEHPNDINFIFSAAAMGLDETSTVASIITKIIRHEDLEEGFQYGVVSGDCPGAEGFRLDQYKTTDEIKKYLSRYDSNNLPALVTKAARERFTAANGGRDYANKTAVIFVGGAKVDMVRLKEAIGELFASGVGHVFVSALDPSRLGPLPEEVIILQGTPLRQSVDLANYLCNFGTKFEEGEILPDYEYPASEYH